ncbi:DUF6668 family protein [Streptomyces globisporus]|uniref:DUF6668 family protein n=1 Tax=Streptomyces globisporus TaxID=1908 RepID=UPI00368CC88F
MVTSNPWVTRESAAAEPVHPTTIEHIHVAQNVTVRPQPGAVAAPQQGLPVRTAAGARWWWLGCHGGAGVTSLTGAVPGGTDAGRYWPVPASGPVQRVVLVARTHASGLEAAQLAARQWASGVLPGVDLLGLVVVADAPGRLPGPLRDLLRLVEGGVPRTWAVPWEDSWRLAAPSAESVSRPVGRMARDLLSLTDPGVSR